MDRVPPELHDSEAAFNAFQFWETPLEQLEGWLERTEQRIEREIASAPRSDIAGNSVGRQLVTQLGAALREHSNAVESLRALDLQVTSGRALLELRRADELREAASLVTRLELVQQLLHDVGEVATAPERVEQLLEKARNDDDAVMKAVEAVEDSLHRAYGLRAQVPALQHVHQALLTSSRQLSQELCQQVQRQLFTLHTHETSNEVWSDIEKLLVLMRSNDTTGSESARQRRLRLQRRHRLRSTGDFKLKPPVVLAAAASALRSILDEHPSLHSLVSRAQGVCRLRSAAKLRAMLETSLESNVSAMVQELLQKTAQDLYDSARLSWSLSPTEAFVVSSRASGETVRCLLTRVFAAVRGLQCALDLLDLCLTEPELPQLMSRTSNDIPLSALPKTVPMTHEKNLPFVEKTLAVAQKCILKLTMPLLQAKSIHTDKEPAGEKQKLQQNTPLSLLTPMTLIGTPETKEDSEITEEEIEWVRILQQVHLLQPSPLRIAPLAQALPSCATWLQARLVDFARTDTFRFLTDVSVGAVADIFADATLTAHSEHALPSLARLAAAAQTKAEAVEQSEDHLEYFSKFDVLWKISIRILDELVDTGLWPESLHRAAAQSTLQRFSARLEAKIIAETAHSAAASAAFQLNRHFGDVDPSKATPLAHKTLRLLAQVARDCERSVELYQLHGMRNPLKDTRRRVLQVLHMEMRVQQHRVLHQVSHLGGAVVQQALAKLWQMDALLVNNLSSVGLDRATADVWQGLVRQLCAWRAELIRRGDMPSHTANNLAMAWRVALPQMTTCPLEEVDALSALDSDDFIVV
ncbi:MAG: hypothetical protein MHM6MM_006085 [Cercozoa sp. M6MM]